MFDTLPKTAHEAMDWDTAQFQPYFDDLQNRDVNVDNIYNWLADWSALVSLLREIQVRCVVATNVDTTDEVAEANLNRFLENVYPLLMRGQNDLNQKLLATGLTPDGFDVPLRNIRADADLFREENVPLLVEENKLTQEYDKIVGAQTVEWDGEEVTLTQLGPVYFETDRERREKAWRMAMERRLQDRDALNDLWQKFMPLRKQIALNAGKSDYRAYLWQDLSRFDYTPEDCETFHRAIEEIVVPAAARIYEKQRMALGLSSLRPWDTEVDAQGRDPLRPFEDVADLQAVTGEMFNRVDPELGRYFQTMRDENLLDLDNRKGKAPGGYCTYLAVAKRPFIFMNAVGLHDDVQTMLHEAGHAFHGFSAGEQPYYQQRRAPMEFNEVASMAMELLAAPYLTKDEGGFYSTGEAARARIEHLEGIIKFWPYMAVVDAFQHWAYMNHDAATNPANCDAKWTELWDRYMVGIDYSGFDDIKMTGWHRKLHIFHVPLYYVEYGLAQLGAVQVYGNARKNQAEALKAYRRALALGGTAKLPDLYQAAGAKFAFDTDVVGKAVELIEQTLHELEAAAAAPMN